MDFVFSFVIAMLICMVTLPLMIYLAHRFAFIDEPSPRKVHTGPIPRIGGPAIALGSILAVAVMAPDLLQPKTMALLLAGLIVLFVGLLDDRRELGYRAKFLAQFAAAVVVVYVGDVQLHTLTLPHPVTIPAWLSYPASVVLIVALMNAVALSDGLDGLAGGVVFLCCVALGILGYLTGNVAAALVAVALAGSLFGFLRFNTHPASVFMGDSGSQYIGLVSAVLALDVTQSEQARISAALPLFLLAVPIIDTIQVSLLRIRRGKSPFVADKNHLHHRLLDLGFRHHEAVLVIYLVQSAFFLLAYYLRFQSDLFVGSLFFAAAALVIAAISLAEQVQSQRQLECPVEPARPGHGPQRQWVSAMLARLVVLLLVLYALLLAVQPLVGNMESGQYTTSTLWQVRSLVLLMLLALAACLFHPDHAVSRLTKTAVGYVSAAVLAFLASSTSWQVGVLRYVEAGLLAALALACVASLGSSNRNGAQLTTLDILILFGALTIPNLPGLMTAQSGIGMLAVRLVVCFYAAEALAGGPRGTKALPLMVILGTILSYLYFIELSL